MTTTSEDGRRLVQAWVPREMRDELERRARRNERSLSGELRLAITEHLTRRTVVHQPPRGEQQ